MRKSRSTEFQIVKALKVATVKCTEGNTHHRGAIIACKPVRELGFSIYPDVVHHVDNPVPSTAGGSTQLTEDGHTGAGPSRQTHTRFVLLGE